MKKQQKQAKENLQETQDRKHKKIPNGKKSRARTLKFDANNEVPRFCSNVSVFKQLINSGPYYMCVVCNRCLYRRSVGLFNRNKFCAISDDVFSLIS